MPVCLIKYKDKLAGSLLSIYNARFLLREHDSFITCLNFNGCCMKE